MVPEASEGVKVVGVKELVAAVVSVGEAEVVPLWVLGATAETGAPVELLCCARRTGRTTKVERSEPVGWNIFRLGKRVVLEGEQGDLGSEGMQQAKFWWSR